MRILIGTETITEKELKNGIDFLEDELCMKVDFYEKDYETTEYCIDIRHYDMAYIEYNKKYDNILYTCFGYAKKKEVVPKINLIVSEDQKKNNHTLKKFTDNYSFVKILNKEDFDLEKHVSEEMLGESTLIERDNLKLSLKDKKITFTKDGEEMILEFKKGIDFYVLLYFIRNYKETVNMRSLLDATCSEPEYTKNSIIESSISSIRKMFKDIFDINPIKNSKKVGYRFSMD